MTLVAANGDVIQTIAYQDSSPWPSAADGSGPSIEFVNLLGDPSSGANWRASSMTGGSPGWDGNPGLAGDYNKDNRVDGADFLAWQRSYGTRTPALVGADGSGNLLVDAPDLAVWSTHFGQTQAIAAAVTAPSSSSAWLVAEEDAPVMAAASYQLSTPAGLPFLAAVETTQRRFDAAFASFGADNGRSPRGRDAENDWSRHRFAKPAAKAPTFAHRSGNLQRFQERQAANDVDEATSECRDAALGLLADRLGSSRDDLA